MVAPRLDTSTCIPPKMTIRTILFLLLLAASFKYSKAQTPHLSGDVYISLSDGLIRADLEISRIPQPAVHSIWLNSGFTVQWIRDTTEQRFDRAFHSFDPQKTYVNFQHYVPNDGGGEWYQPSRLRMKYVGAFPVYFDSEHHDQYMDEPEKIAFDGKILRADEQSGWYPTLYDTLQNIVRKEVTYDLTIHAPGAKSIYLNGSAPQPGPVARFQSDKPFRLLLFVGDYDYQITRNTYLINTDLNDTLRSVLDDRLDRIKEYFEKRLDIVQDQKIALLHTVPVSKIRYNEWWFETYPTMGNASEQEPIDRQVKMLTDGPRLNSSGLQTYARNLGRYYFGIKLQPNSPLRLAFAEGFTEYLSLQAGRDLADSRDYERQVMGLSNAVWQLKDSFVPLKMIKSEHELSGTYRYKFIPLLLTQLEEKVGREQMWKWLHLILSKENPTTDYSFLLNTMVESGIDETIVTDLESEYLTSRDGLKRLAMLYRPKVDTLYCLGYTSEPTIEGSTDRPRFYHTPIIKIPHDLDSLDAVENKFREIAYAKLRKFNLWCGNVADFNTYFSLEEAQRILRNLITNSKERFIVEELDY